MFDLSNDAAILRTKIHHLEKRKQRLLSASADDTSTLYWVQADLQRIEAELREAKEQLAEKERAE
jgi:hypothetical protein